MKIVLILCTRSIMHNLKSCPNCRLERISNRNPSVHRIALETLLKYMYMNFVNSNAVPSIAACLCHGKTQVLLGNKRFPSQYSYIHMASKTSRSENISTLIFCLFALHSICSESFPINARRCH